MGGGATWVATVLEIKDGDYKGRFWLILSPEGEGAKDAADLVDVRWNCLKTAKRTLLTMSAEELRRPLNSASRRSA